MPDSKSEPFDKVDAAWLRMDDPTNLMMITGVLMFDHPVDFARLQSIVEQRMLRFDRFRMRVRDQHTHSGQPHWELDPHFAMRAHMRRIALPAPGDQPTLQRLVSDFMSTPLDFSKPLWQIHLVEGFGTGCAVLARFHHSIADGIALVRVLLLLTDTDIAPVPPVEADVAPDARGPLDALLRPARAVFDTAVRASEAIVQEGREAFLDPTRLVDAARLGVSGAAALNKLLFQADDPPTIFRGPLGIEKSAVWSRATPLDDIKAVGRMTRATVNDVLINAVAGALRRYLIAHGQPIDGSDFRAVVPVNLRSLDQPITELGNRFGVVFLALPIGIADPFDRILELKRRMAEIKDSPEAVVAFGILNVIGTLTPDLVDISVNMFGSKATAVMTNVPGPSAPIYLAGQTVRQIMFWVPQSGRLGLGVSIFSYAGEVLLGIATDTGLVPDPEQIIAEFEAELDELLRLARVLEAPESYEAPQ